MIKKVMLFFRDSGKMGKKMGMESISTDKILPYIMKDTGKTI